jgi:hypothetical protein
VNDNSSGISASDDNNTTAENEKPKKRSILSAFEDEFEIPAFLRRKKSD